MRSATSTSTPTGSHRSVGHWPCTACRSPRAPISRIARQRLRSALWDTTITEILAGYYEPDAEGKRPPECLYGSLKMWAHR
ncbi:Conserved protein of unknown function [Mycobacterium canettii CIPT 140070008]|nr:Conserved protein of unknown function [Mycobacterium canettii CIPT 140070008]